MQAFENIMNQWNSLVWSLPLVILCLSAGVIFSVRMKFPQVRMVKEMVRLLIHGEKSDTGITPFQAFASTVGSRVGMGNIAGVATAIYFGGPGAVFWMWVIAFIGASSAFIESTLAQAYKVKTGNGEYLGGPAYFIEKGLRCKPWAIIFAVATILGPGILMPGLHVNSIASTYNEAFGTNMLVVGVIFCAVFGIVICGGIKRIASVAEYMAPVMCVIYVALAIGIVGMNITKVPGVLATIVSSAFGVHQVFGAVVGSALSWGVKRGIYSNEAGQGSGAIVSAAAECSHPAKQGLVQAFSVYIDTLIVCTASALIILLTNTFNTVAPNGTDMLAENIPGVEYGIRWATNALNRGYGDWAGKALAIIIIMFVFTSLMGYYYQAEANVRYLLKENKVAVWIMRVVFLFSAFSGVLVNGQIIWTMGDTGAGMMAWLNIVAILFLGKKGFAILKDYEDQKKAGIVEPMFDPAKFDIEDETKVWDRYNKK